MSAVSVSTVPTVSAVSAVSALMSAVITSPLSFGSAEVLFLLSVDTHGQKDEESQGKL